MPFNMDQMRCVTEGQLSALVELARKEDWRLLDYRKDERFWVLRRYLKNTFLRLAYEYEDLGRYEKMRFDGAWQDALIDTGLVDEQFHKIYARVNLHHRTRNGIRYYGFNSFFTNTRSYFLTDLMAEFRLRSMNGVIDAGELPKRATYFNPEQFIFSASFDFRFGAYPHIVKERLYRFPLPFVRSLVNDGEMGDRLIDRLVQAKKADEAYDIVERDRIIREEVDPILSQGNEDLYLKINNRLDDAIHAAVENARYNFTTAMLGYYPAQHTVCFYLPICLTTDGQPDFALLVQRVPKRKLYVPATILSLDEAFANLRLVMPMSDNWVYTAAQDVRQTNKERRFSALTAVVENEDDTEARAKLRITDAIEVVKSVQSGFTIGRKYGSEFVADITLDTSHEHISRHQGDFNCHGGIWKFIPYGLNETSVVRAEDPEGEPEVHHLVNGLPFVLHNGDQLVFGKSDPQIIFLLEDEDPNASADVGASQTGLSAIDEG